jgi:3-(3-hydroxy-phenyl)propionate hydroxylase
LLEPWGLTPDNAELERAAVYRFQARWAKTWNKGRCLIGGDAAHLMPPFAGEGMCAGVRDAVAMAWRLNGILEGKLSMDVLDSYTSERIEHAKHYINFSQELGQIICIADEDAAAERDAAMIKALAERENAPVPTDICRLGQGVWDVDSAHAGELSVQGIVESSGHRDRFDQIVGQGWVLLGYDADPAQALAPEQLAQLQHLEGITVQISPAGTSGDVVDAEGTFDAWLQQIDARYVLIRPDFYVALTANSAEALRSKFAEIMDRLHITAPVAAE